MLPTQRVDFIHTGKTVEAGGGSVSGDDDKGAYREHDLRVQQIR